MPFAVNDNIMQRIISILSFYRPFVLWSFGINIAIAIVNPFILPAITTKLLLTIFVWYMVNETRAKRKLKVYKNLGIAPFKLFSILFLIDCFITVSFIIIRYIQLIISKVWLKLAKNN